jgi:hypothetical protein
MKREIRGPSCAGVVALVISLALMGRSVPAQESSQPPPPPSSSTTRGGGVQSGMAQPALPTSTLPGEPQRPGTAVLPDGAADRSLPSTPRGPMGLPLPAARSSSEMPPGAPPKAGRPRPGSLLDPGATGPGISQGEENFLDGALDPRTGWPFVLLDHFSHAPSGSIAFGSSVPETVPR